MPDNQRAPRIPLFALVEAPLLGAMYALNISDGGVYLKAPGVPGANVPLGRPLALELDLPDGGPRMSISGEVVWVDPVAREYRGESALGLGVRFVAIGQDNSARIRGFVESFRYQVVVFGFAEPTLVAAAFGDTFEIKTVTDLNELLPATTGGHVGLVLLGEASGRDLATRALEQLLKDPSTEHGPPILYSADTPSAELERTFNHQPRLLVATLPLERLELRSLVRHAVSAFVLSFQNQLLGDELQRAVERLRRENEYLREQVVDASPVEGMVGESAAMQRVYELIERVAPLPTSVMVLGETGTGKELVVRAIHAKSARKNRAFVAQNCAALAETLLDNELFGHARGAFTGAVNDSPGLFEVADGGTMFLDEVGEMPAAMQAKLLRVLEDGEVRRVGETRSRKVNVRVLCATHRDLEALVKEGTFRGDLLYRLRTFVIKLPALRERREDLPALVLHFLSRCAERYEQDSAGVTVEAMRLLQEHEWPGNARELAHTVERLFVLTPKGKKIDASLVQEVLGNAQTHTPDPSDQTLEQRLVSYERSLIAAELTRSAGVVSHAAKALGVDRTTLSRRIKRLGL